LVEGNAPRIAPKIYEDWLAVSDGARRAIRVLEEIVIVLAFERVLPIRTRQVLISTLIVSHSRKKSKLGIAV